VRCTKWTVGVLLCSKEPREADMLDEDNDYDDAAAAAETEEQCDERFDREDYFPVQDEELYDEGKHAISDVLFF